ncbi:MAG: DUF3466 family protein, partial [Verrucomicrobia bacterium]|nr:DUF3466 family protein [Verrucomicrobiota bacterium]
TASTGLDQFGEQSSQLHAFLYRQGTLIDLGALLPAGTNSSGVSINGWGEVLGSYTTSTVSDAFLYRNGKLRLLPESLATLDLNDLGEIVVRSESGAASVRRPDGTLVPVPDSQYPPLGNQNPHGYNILEPRAMNDLSQIVCRDFAPATANQPETDYDFVNNVILLQPGGADQIVASSSLDNYCFPTAMNILGQSVGYNVSLYFNTSYGDFFYDGGIAALYTGGKSISLGSLHPAALAGGVPASSAAKGVNNFGIIVGLSETSDYPENATAGFIYLNGTMYNLNDLVNTTASGLTITEAQGINDLGQIVATAIDASGSEHAVILTPEFR